MFGLIPILFFLSGFTALIYQMVWMRELILVFGASMFAISTLLTAFMGGLALGSWYFGKQAERYRNPLQAYALLELGIGGYAFFVPFLFSSLIPIYQGISHLFNFSFYAFSLVRFVLGILILIFPTALMGGTLPILAQLYKNREAVGRGVGLLYAFNTLGAVIGVLGAGFVLLPMLGLKKTVLIAAGLNGLISLTAHALGKRHVPPAAPAAPENNGHYPKKRRKHKSLSDGEGRQRTVLLAVFAISGLSAMIYEVVWTRILTLILGSTVYSYATMLSTYLLGLALGSFLFSLLLKRFLRPLLLLTLIQAGIALFGFAGEFVFPLLPTIFVKIMTVFHTWSKVRTASKFILSGAVMLIPTLLMGGIFPLIIHILTKKEAADTDRLGAIVGRAYAVNTIGTIAGSFSVGFLLLPFLGIQKTLHLAIMINSALALALWVLLSEREAAKRPSLQGRSLAMGGAFSFFIIMSFSSPVWNPLAISSELFGQQDMPLNLVYYKEGISATVTVTQHQTLAKIPHLTLSIDGKPNASTTGDMKTQLLVAHLPMLLADQAKEVMLIGHGSGITTGSMTTHPITRLITLELEPAVIEGSRFFDPFSGSVLDDPRVSLAMDDARNYLLRTDERYDVIVSEPSHPWRSGSAKLFTQEFFQLGKEHLRAGGVFSQWIHFYGIRATELKSVIKTFHSVFEQVLIFYTDAGDLILLGSETPFKIDRKEITRRMKQSGVAQDLARAEVYSIYDLWSHFLLGPNEIDRYVGDAVLNTDDFTLVEFQTPKSLFEDTISLHIAEMKAAAADSGDYLFAPGESPAARAAGDYGIAKSFFRADKLKEATDRIEKGMRLHPSAEGLWLQGRVLLREGDRQGAEAAWLRVLEQDPAHEETLLSLVKFYHTQGAFKKAVPYLEKISPGTVVDLKAAYYKGVNLYFQGKYEAALEPLQRGMLFSEPFVYYYQKLTHEKLGHKAASKDAMAKFILSLNDWRKELELTPKKFKSLQYLKEVAWRRKVGIQIPEEERMALIFERVVSEPLGHLYNGAGLYLLRAFEASVNNLEQGIQSLGQQASGSMLYYYLGLSYKEMRKPQKEAAAFEAFLKAPILNGKDIRIIEIKKLLEQLSI